MVLRIRRSHVLRGSIPGQFMSFFSLWAYLKHGYVLSGSSVSACCVVLVYKAVYTCGFWYTLVHTWVTFRSDVASTGERVNDIVHGMSISLYHAVFCVGLDSRYP